MPKSTGSDWSYAAASGGITGTSDVALQAANAGQRHFLTSLQVKNSHTSTATEVVVKDGSTVIWRMHCSAAATEPACVIFDPPLVGTKNTALNVACVTNSTATYVNAQGFTAP